MRKKPSLQEQYSWIVTTLIAFRVLAAPIVAIFYLNNHIRAAFWLFLLAASTDILDGIIARRIGGAVLPLGAYTDPVADFILVMAVFTAFTIAGVYSFWVLLLLAALFGQFLATSKSSHPVYDPLGKYSGGILFAIIGLNITLRHEMIYIGSLIIILSFVFSVLYTRLILVFKKSETVKSNG